MYIAAAEVAGSIAMFHCYVPLLCAALQFKYLTFSRAAGAGSIVTYCTLTPSVVQQGRVPL